MDYDASVIGSGAGGLTAAVALAPAGMTQSSRDAAKAALHCRTRNILTQHGPSLTFLPSDGKAVSVCGRRI
ncbi:MAG: hypothetical protein HY870_06455 [Chloroflexi bacterium]|nr:hypothetical protein [Chloroflexota bacterium]